MAPDQEHDVTMTMIRIRVQEVRQRTKSRRRLVAGTIGAAAVVSGVMALLTSRTKMRASSPTEPFRSAEALLLTGDMQWTGELPLPSHHDIPGHIRENVRSNMQTAHEIQNLLMLRSRIDRLAWNMLYGRHDGGPRAAEGKDWSECALFLVSIGSAMEDMHKVLAVALANPEGDDAHGLLVGRSFEAYVHLTLARVPACWKSGSPLARGTRSDRLMWNAWQELCEGVANVIGFEPRYGIH